MSKCPLVERRMFCWTDGFATTPARAQRCFQMEPSCRVQARALPTESLLSDNLMYCLLLVLIIIIIIWLHIMFPLKMLQMEVKVLRDESPWKKQHISRSPFMQTFSRAVGRMLGDAHSNVGLSVSVLLSLIASSAWVGVCASHKQGRRAVLYDVWVSALLEGPCIQGALLGRPNPAAFCASRCSVSRWICARR